MRKSLLARTLLVFALILSILVCAVPEDTAHAAKLTNKKVQKVLKRKIKNKFSRYAFSDLDKDGFDELITIQYDGIKKNDEKDVYYNTRVLVYKYSGGKVKVIFSWEDIMYDNNDISLYLYYDDTCYLKMLLHTIDFEDDYYYYKLSEDGFHDLCYVILNDYENYEYYLADMVPSTKKKVNNILKKFPKEDQKIDVKLKLSNKKLANNFVKDYLTALIPELSGYKDSVKSEIKDIDGNGIVDLLINYDSGKRAVYSVDIDSYGLILFDFIDNVTDDSEEVREYVKENYPRLIKLADKGRIRFSAEYERDMFKLGSWDMEYWEERGEGEDTKYVLTTDGTKEDIEWEVLGYSEDGQYAYAISRYILFNRQFNEKKAKVNYSQSTLCKYLNGEFYENAFSESEKELIGDSSANDQNFKVTILNMVELRRYYDYGPEINTKERIGTYIDGEVGSWWTRTHGLPYDDDHEYYRSAVYSLKRRVLYDGSIDSSYNGNNEEEDAGTSVASSCGVRPFITIRLTPEFIEANNLSVGKVKPNLKKVFVVFGISNVSETSSAPMVWEILDYDAKSGKALLASRYIEKIIAYDDREDIKETTWKDCTLRKWLNSDFYKDAFSKKEKALITANTYSEGEDMEDNVFILSYSEVKKYYPLTDVRSEIDRICALRNGASRDWWLRTPDEESGITSANVALIDSWGGFHRPSATAANEGYCEESLYYDDYDFGMYDHAVRPAIYIKLK